RVLLRAHAAVDARVCGRDCGACDRQHRVARERLGMVERFHGSSHCCNALCQSPADCWRQNRMLRYHGDSHRQLAQCDNSAVMRGWPIAPARCKAAVSTVTISSRTDMSAAQSAKFSNSTALIRVVQVSGGGCVCTL